MIDFLIVKMQIPQHLTSLKKKLILNSFMLDSSKGARFMSLEIKDHFLATPITDPEHVTVMQKHIPNEIKSRHIID